MKSESSVFLPEMELEAVVKAGLFKDRVEAVREAVITFFAVKPKMRLEAAIQLYRQGEVTLGRASEISGLDQWEFRSILEDRGIKIVVECDAKEEMDKRIRRMVAK
ncbi:MAG: UPF0175 family protein [bacterium]|nr:UPF0175 family protein [bacterium]